jgi:hypothetical protein
MSAMAKIVLAGTALAALTAGLGLLGISGWDGETGGHWVALVGFTFLYPLLQTGSLVFAGVCHWLVCMAGVGLMYGISRFVRHATGSDAPMANPFPTPKPLPDAPVMPTTEEVARVVSGRGKVLPPPPPASPS